VNKSFTKFSNPNHSGVIKFKEAHRINTGIQSRFLQEEMKPKIRISLKLEIMKGQIHSYSLWSLRWKRLA
jgi:hypothetical protein